MIKYGVIPEEIIAAADIENMKTLFLDAEPQNVFNEKDIEDIDLEHAERKQLVTKHYRKVSRGCFTETQRKLLELCENTAVSVVARLLRTVKEFKTIESILYSRDGSQERQKLHADLSNVLACSAALVLVALEPGTTFIMCRGSHQESGILKKNRLNVFQEFMS